MSQENADFAVKKSRILRAVSSIFIVINTLELSDEEVFMALLNSALQSAFLNGATQQYFNESCFLAMKEYERCLKEEKK